MADTTNTNPFLSDDDDFIENTLESQKIDKLQSADTQDPNWDSIAAKLLKDKFILTALELHTELVEGGKELPRLRDFFSNPGNFERTKEDSPPSTLPRTSSIQTFDSLDFARYSDDGEKQVDERVAVLEFELRKAQDTIKSLRASLTKEAEKEQLPRETESEGNLNVIGDESMKSMEKKALNFLVNEYLLQINNKLSAVTFSEENEDQDFEDWDDVGLNISQPPDLLHLYRDFQKHLVPSKDVCHTDCQTDMEGKTIEQIQKELGCVKKEWGAKIEELQEELLYKDKEMLRRRGVAEGSESDAAHSPYNEHQSTVFDDNDVPFHNYETHNQSDEEDDNLQCTCDPNQNEKCAFCVRVQSPEVYRLDFTDDGDHDHSGDREMLDNSRGSDLENGVKDKSSKVVKRTQGDSDEAVSDNKSDNANVSDGGGDVCDNIYKDNQNKEGETTETSHSYKAKQTTPGNIQVKTDCINSDSKMAVRDRNIEIRQRERTPTRSKRKGNGTHGSNLDDDIDKGSGMEESQKINRKMSHAFKAALREVCFHVPMDNRIVMEVSRISDADQQQVVLMLARCLPHIVPNVLLAKREELIPLIICTTMLHPDAKERDKLLNILFNLIKKPDEEQRQMILTGCIAFAQHVGPTRVEAELLPQCWEQISHKYMERRLLVAEACGALAAYLPSQIRSSLVLSMLQQMLQDDKEADVREAVVRSLGMIIGFISDQDKYPQGTNLLMTALRDSVEKVVMSAKHLFLPSFAMWAYELGKLNHSLLHSILRDLEELTAIACQKSPGVGMAPLNEGRYLLYVTTLQELVPFLYISVLESGPYMDRLDTVMATIGDIHGSRFPASSSRLTDLTTIAGNKRYLAAMVYLFEDHIDQEWFEPWDNLNWVVNNLIPRLLEVVMGSALAFPRIVSCLAHCFYTISTIFGKTFVDKKVKPRFIDVLLMGEEHIDPSSTFTSSSTPLTTCVLPVYTSGVLSAFDTEEDQTQLCQFLREALFCLSTYQCSIDSLCISITELCLSSKNHDLLVSVLWEGVVHTSAQVRATAARLFEILLHSVSGMLASTKCVPALITLGSDPEIYVRIATIPALGTIIETVSNREILEKVYMQLQTFLDDPMYRDQHMLHMELVATFARVGPNAEQKFRDEFVLPRLTALALENNSQSNEGKKKEMALQLFEAYSSLSCCFINYQLVQEAMLPGLRCLKQDMSTIAPEHEEVINSMIKEYESKIETSRPADRRSSFTGSFGTPSSGEDMKARMMNRLKESTSKANISSLFNRKK